MDALKNWFTEPSDIERWIVLLFELANCQKFCIYIDSDIAQGKMALPPLFDSSEGVLFNSYAASAENIIQEFHMNNAQVSIGNDLFGMSGVNKYIENILAMLLTSCQNGLKDYWLSSIERFPDKYSAQALIYWTVERTGPGFLANCLSDLNLLKKNYTLPEKLRNAYPFLKGCVFQQLKNRFYFSPNYFNTSQNASSGSWYLENTDGKLLQKKNYQSIDELIDDIVFRVNFEIKNLNGNNYLNQYMKRIGIDFCNLFKNEIELEYFHHCLFKKLIVDETIKAKSWDSFLNNYKEHSGQPNNVSQLSTSIRELAKMSMFSQLEVSESCGGSEESITPQIRHPE